MDVKEFVKGPGQIFHVHEGKRTITIAYMFLGPKGHSTEVRYGASIHRKDTPQDAWVRKEHNKTAVERCMKKGITIDTDGYHRHALHEFIRKQLYKHGCCADGPTEMFC